MTLELYINNEFIEIDSSIISPLTYSIADVKNPNKRSRNRSKTISIKGTAPNLRAMYSAYNLSLTDSGIGFEFDPNGELTARIVRDGYIIFNGVANFLEVKKSGGVYFFDFQIFGNSIGLFEQLGDRTLQDLGWDEYNHALTIANLELSWDTSVDVDGVPTSNFTLGVPDGFGYLYGLVNWGYASVETTPKTNELIPQFYLKEVIEKCFDIGGYTITGSWIDDEITRRTVISKGGGERVTLQASEITARRCNYTIAGNDSLSLPNYQGIVNGNNITYFYSRNNTYDIGDISPLSTTIANDPRTQFDETNGRATVGSSGTYNVNLNIDLDYTSAWNGGSTTWDNTTSSINIRIIKNNAVIANRIISIVEGVAINESVNFSIQNFLTSGDVIRFDVILNEKGVAGGVNTATPPTLDTSFTINSASFDITSIDTTLQEGDTVEVGRWVPEMKCRDFLNSCIILYNLYLSDPNDDDEVRIETFKNYYDDTDEAENYTLKLDNSKDISIKTNAGIDGKIYKFRFAEDRDAYKDYYFTRWGIDYGDYDYTVPSTFKKGEKEYKVDFAQTVPVQVGSLVIPQVVKRDTTTNVISPHKGKPRIFLYNGLQTGAWTLKNSTTGAGTAETDYPQLHHSDDIASPTFDLNFGVPIEVYYTATNFTNANIFGDLYETQIRELTSVDSKFLTAYFKLNSEDLQGDFMSRLVNINGVVFRKNLISDFDSTGYETTQMELIRVREADNRASTVTLIDTNLVNDDTILGNVTQETTSEITTASSTIDETSPSFALINIDPATQGDVTLSTDLPDGTKRTVANKNGGPLSITADSGNISGFASIELNGDYDSMTFVIVEGVWYIDSKGGSSYTSVREVEAKTVDFDASVEVQTYECDTSSNDIIATLPIDVPNGTRWTFKKMSGLGSLTVKGEGNGAGGFYPVDDDEDGAIVYYNNSVFTVEKSYNNEFKIVG